MCHRVIKMTNYASISTLREIANGLAKLDINGQFRVVGRLREKLVPHIRVHYVSESSLVTMLLSAGMEQQLLAAEQLSLSSKFLILSFSKDLVVYSFVISTANATAYENQVVDILNQHMRDFTRPITIRIGESDYPNMSHAIKVDSNIKRSNNITSDPKADIIVCSDKNNPVSDGSIYISHKKAGGPEAFQQYGGISKKTSPAIHNSVAAQVFMRIVSDLIGEEEKLTAPVMMEFDDVSLANMSIYGPEYHGPYSLQHTQIIAQGLPILTPVFDNTYSLTFTSHMSLSGDLTHFTGGYTPVLGATFRNGRSFEYGEKRYTGARVAVYPKKLMASRTNLIKI